MCFRWKFPIRPWKRNCLNKEYLTLTGLWFPNWLIYNRNDLTMSIDLKFSIYSSKRYSKVKYLKSVLPNKTIISVAGLTSVKDHSMFTFNLHCHAKRKCYWKISLSLLLCKEGTPPYSPHSQTRKWLLNILMKCTLYLVYFLCSINLMLFSTLIFS